MRIIQMLMATSAAAMMQPASANHIHDERHKEPSPIAPPGPVQEGAPFDRCYAWILAAPGDTCHSIESKVGLPHGLLRGYNAQLHGDCDNNLWAGYYYCWGKRYHTISILPVSLLLASVIYYFLHG
ncbi:hypothetical protein RRF57_004822 [Xylaria bambusicola]|uniref:LysM domain-containing protein n=1 Tax=Xylaria bambusicola TaxID=326684 RepID=A0AAN7Z4N7_9PEZI